MNNLKNTVQATEQLNLKNLVASNMQTNYKKVTQTNEHKLQAARNIKELVGIEIEQVPD